MAVNGWQQDIVYWRCVRQVGRASVGDRGDVCGKLGHWGSRCAGCRPSNGGDEGATAVVWMTRVSGQHEKCRWHCPDTAWACACCPVASDVSVMGKIGHSEANTHAYFTVWVGRTGRVLGVYEYGVSSCRGCGGRNEQVGLNDSLHRCKGGDLAMFGR